MILGICIIMSVFRREYNTKKGATLAKNWSCEFFIDDKRYAQVLAESEKFTKKQAEVRCEQIKDETKQKLKRFAVADFDTAMEAYYSQYLARISKRRSKTHKCVHDRYYYVVKKLKIRFSGKRLDQITRGDIVSMIMDRRKEGVSDSTVANDVACLMSVYNYAENIELCNHSDIPNFKSIKKILRKSPPRTRYLSENEYDALLEASSSSLKNIIILATQTGLRKEEFLSLRWADVSLDTGRIMVRDAKNGKDRSVPMSAEVKELLQNLLHQNSTIKSDYVLCKPSGARYLDFKKSFASACVKANVKNLRIHDFRHTFGSWHLQNIRSKKLTLKEVSLLLGHATTSITEQSYAFLDELNITL